MKRRKKGRWKERKEEGGGAVTYLKCTIDSLSLKTLLCFIKLIKNLVPHHVGYFPVVTQMYEQVVLWKTWGYTGAVSVKYLKSMLDGLLFCFFFDHFASTYTPSTWHVPSSSTPRCLRSNKH